MTLVRTCVAVGSLTSEQESHVAAGSTDVCGEAEGIPKLRRAIRVYINEIPDRDWGIGGEVHAPAQMRAHYGLTP